MTLEKREFIYYRYLVLFIGFFCLMSIASNVITINFAVICMQDPNDTITLKDGSTRVRFNYTQTENSMIQWAVSAGTIVGTFPVSILYIHFGARYTFLTAGLMSALATLAMPALAYYDFFALLVARFIQGLAYSADFAAIGQICVRWASLKQYALFIGVLTSFTPVSVVITHPVAGQLCSSPWGWQSIFYSHGVVGLIFFTLWTIFYTDDPQNTNRVSAVELEKIQRGKTKAHIERDSFVPYWEVLTNPIMIVTWINAFCEICAAITLLTYTPIYFNKVLNMNPKMVGIAGALPHVIHMPCKLLVAVISDKYKGMSEVRKMVLFNTIAVGGVGLGFACLAYAPPEHPIVAIIITTAIAVSAGFNCAGFYKCATFVARQYSHFVLSNIQFSKCIALFVGPALVAVFVKNNADVTQWRYVWLTFACVLFAVNCLFYFMATDEPAAFTLITRETVAEEKARKAAEKKRPVEVY